MSDPDIHKYIGHKLILFSVRTNNLELFKYICTHTYKSKSRPSNKSRFFRKVFGYLIKYPSLPIIDYICTEYPNTILYNGRKFFNQICIHGYLDSVKRVMQILIDEYETGYANPFHDFMGVFNEQHMDISTGWRRAMYYSQIETSLYLFELFIKYGAKSEGFAFESLVTDSFAIWDIIHFNKECLIHILLCSRNKKLIVTICDRIFEIANGRFGSFLYSLNKVKGYNKYRHILATHPLFK